VNLTPPNDVARILHGGCGQKLVPDCFMLLRNDVLHYDGPTARALRILWIDPAREIAYTFELAAPAALPQPARLRMLEADVLTRRARLLLVDPYAAPARIAAPPDRHLQMQQRAWEIVGALAPDTPAIFKPRQRARLIATCAALHAVSRQTVLRYLRRYWKRGQTRDALLPDYGNSGGRGKTRAASSGIKRGRPRKGGSHPGLNADQQVRATFRAAVARYAATHAEFSRRAAYRQMIEDFFGDRDAEAVPTFGQFSYWIEKDQPVSLA
jgi:hypothetical protein